MKNYVITIKISNVTNYDDETVIKILSTIIAKNITLYSIDYHGYDHGISVESDENSYYINIIVNNVNFEIEDVVDEIKEALGKYNIYDVASVINIMDKETEIPEYCMEQYYFVYYDIN